MQPREFVIYSVVRITAIVILNYLCLVEVVPVACEGKTTAVTCREKATEKLGAFVCILCATPLKMYNNYLEYPYRIIKNCHIGLSILSRIIWKSTPLLQHKHFQL